MRLPRHESMAMRYTVKKFVQELRQQSKGMRALTNCRTVAADFPDACYFPG